MKKSKMKTELKALRKENKQMKRRLRIHERPYELIQP
jgi:hypothetical protein